MQADFTIRRYKLMGRSQQSRPKKLAMKLKKIRDSLGLSKKQMTDRLKELAPDERLGTGHVYQYEEGSRLPSYLILLAYARSVGISTDYLIDDSLELDEIGINITASDWVMERNNKLVVI
jgi:transcriptional regulator with XRE-family HTH domain